MWAGCPRRNQSIEGEPDWLCKALELLTMGELFSGSRNVDCWPREARDILSTWDCHAIRVHDTAWFNAVDITPAVRLAVTCFHDGIPTVDVVGMFNQRLLQRLRNTRDRVYNTHLPWVQPEDLHILLRDCATEQLFRALRRYLVDDARAPVHPSVAHLAICYAWDDARKSVVIDEVRRAKLLPRARVGVPEEIRSLLSDTLGPAIAGPPPGTRRPRPQRYVEKPCPPSPNSSPPSASSAAASGS